MYKFITVLCELVAFVSILAIGFALLQFAPALDHAIIEMKGNYNGR